MHYNHYTTECFVYTEGSAPTYSEPCSQAIPAEKLGSLEINEVMAHTTIKYMIALNYKPTLMCIDTKSVSEQ